MATSRSRRDRLILPELVRRLASGRVGAEVGRDAHALASRLTPHVTDCSSVRIHGPVLSAEVFVELALARVGDRVTEASHEKLLREPHAAIVVDVAVDGVLRSCLVAVRLFAQHDRVANADALLPSVLARLGGLFEALRFADEELVLTLREEFERGG